MKESKEAMKLALEALRQIDEAMPFPVAKLAQSALQEALAEQPAQIDCCANCLSPKREHKGEACPKPYTTVWHAWDYNFPPKQKAQQLIHCKHKRENGGVCPHHNLQCGWPKCNEQEQPAQQEPVAFCVYCDGQFTHNICHSEDLANFRAAALEEKYPRYKRKVVPLYESPPQRTWVGLTDEERYLGDARSEEEIEYARAIESKLKDKNI